MADFIKLPNWVRALGDTRWNIDDANSDKVGKTTRKLADNMKSWNTLSVKRSSSIKLRSSRQARKATSFSVLTMWLQMPWSWEHCGKNQTSRQKNSGLWRSRRNVCSLKCDKDTFRILPCIHPPDSDWCVLPIANVESYSAFLRWAQNVSEGVEQHADRTEGWKNRCLHAQSGEKRDNSSDNDYIKETGFVTVAQNLQSLSLGKFHVGTMRKNPNSENILLTAFLRISPIFNKSKYLYWQNVTLLLYLIQ